MVYYSEILSKSTKTLSFFLIYTKSQFVCQCYNSIFSDKKSEKSTTKAVKFNFYTKLSLYIPYPQGILNICTLIFVYHIMQIMWYLHFTAHFFYHPAF